MHCLIAAPCTPLRPTGRCPWCQRLGPTWEAVTEDIHNRYPESDGRIRMAKVGGVGVGVLAPVGGASQLTASQPAGG